MKILNLKHIKKNFMAIILSIIAVNLTILSFKNDSLKIVTANFYVIDNSLLSFKSDEKKIVEKSVIRKSIFKKYLGEVSKKQNLIILDNRFVNVASKEDITDQLLILVDDIKKNEKL
ncbi:hypothetical protein N9X24_01230 [Rickettsiales bacterium]|nr:hypothetical protein [Rickettsiales bacterium]